MPLRQQPLAGEIDAYLRKKGSPLAGLGSAFVGAGGQSGVDPRLMVAIAGAESSLGKYGPSQRIHNPFGMGPNIQYPSYQAAIGALAQNLAKNYFGQGLNTIADISKKYAPANAANDPTGLNANWVRNVSQYYHELGGQQVQQDPQTAQDTADYVKTASLLESQYADVGEQAPMHLTDFVTPNPAPQMSPIRSIGELSQRLADSPIAPTPRDTGSNAIVSARIQDELRQRVSEAAAQHGLSVAWDDNSIVSPNTPAFVAEAANYQSSKKANAVVGLGEHFLGTPYKWGGETPQEGFDCSGFAQYLYGKQGITLPRTTYQQIKVGKPVGMKELEPGDLIFFGTRKDPHHEGIYIGHGQFIHAPHTGDVVKISSLTDDYYRRNFVTGRRVTR